MIINFGNMGQTITCDICGDSIKVAAWYEIKQAMADNGWVKVGRAKRYKIYCQRCKEGK